MDLLIADWSLAQLTRFLLFGNYAGSIALLYGVALARDVVPHRGHRHHSSRLGAVALLLVGAAGWILPWCVIWSWYRIHLP
jgi:hypothetical protein